MQRRHKLPFQHNVSYYSVNWMCHRAYNGAIWLHDAFCSLETVFTQLLQGSDRNTAGVWSWRRRRKYVDRLESWKDRLHNELTTPAKHKRWHLTNPRILPVGLCPRFIHVQDRLCRRCPSDYNPTYSFPSRWARSLHWFIVGMGRMSYGLFRRTIGLNTSCFRRTDCPLAFDISVAVHRQWFTVMSPGHFRQVYRSEATDRWRNIETQARIEHTAIGTVCRSLDVISAPTLALSQNASKLTFPVHFLSGCFSCSSVWYAGYSGLADVASCHFN